MEQTVEKDAKPRPQQHSGRMENNAGRELGIRGKREDIVETERE